MSATARNVSHHHHPISAIWLSGVELIRTRLPADPTSQGTFWNVPKDVSRYTSLLTQSNLTLSITLVSVNDGVYYHLNLTFFYYNYNAVNSPLSLLPLNQKPTTIRKLKNNPLPKLKNPLELNENPANLIIPISTNGGNHEGFWFKIDRETNPILQSIRIPLNTYRAVIEIYISSHSNDEFWYSNPPNAYIETNKLPTKRGNGAYREVLIKLDDNEVGSVIPFPVGPTTAFNLPSYEVELTPFLGTLLDGQTHNISLKVVNAISFWLVDANMHLWLDDKSDKGQARALELTTTPSFSLDRDFDFQRIYGKFEIKGKRKNVFAGWVKSSIGNLTTYVTHETRYENTMNIKKFNNNGTIKELDYRAKVINEVRVEESNTGVLIWNTNVERNYPLRLTTTSLPGSEEGTYTTITKMDGSIKEEKSDGGYTSVLNNGWKSDGWMFVKDEHVVYGATTSNQSYSVEDSFGCYSRKVSYANGYITNDTVNFLCAGGYSF